MKAHDTPKPGQPPGVDVEAIATHPQIGVGELEVRVKSLQVELVAKQVEKALLVRSTQSHEGELSRGRTRMQELRGADAATVRRK